MKQHLLSVLLFSFAAQSLSLAQKAPSPSPPGQGSGGTSSFPTSSLDRIESQQSRLQRSLDAERMATPEPVTKLVGIQDLERTLASNRGAGDAKLAAILSGFTLSERVTETRLSRWKAEFPGIRTSQALTSLADGSAFLNLPAGDIPDAAMPNLNEQKRIISRVGNYLSKVLPALPNFRATRRTTYFEDRPPRELPLATDPESADRFRNRPMHVVGTSNAQIAYVDGHEVTEKKSGFESSTRDAARFSTAGEFGPILYGVMMDAAQSRIAWAGWEPGSNSLLAVFRFDAAKDRSHFSLKSPGTGESKSQFVAYGGEIAVNPVDGTIMRLSVVARPEQDDATAAAKIVVEYGRVEIGERLYFCPLHAIALSKVFLHQVHPAKAGPAAPLQTQINDVVFEQYHIFRGDPHVTQEAAVP